MYRPADERVNVGGGRGGLGSGESPRSWPALAIGVAVAAGGLVVLALTYLTQMSGSVAWNAFFGSYCLGVGGVAIAGALAPVKRWSYVLISGAAGGLIALAFILIFSIGLGILPFAVVLTVVAVRRFPAHAVDSLLGPVFAVIVVGVLLLGFRLFYL